MKAEVTVTKIGEKWFEIKEVEAPTQPETTKPKLPTLMKVYNKVKPTWYICGNEQIKNGFDENNKMSFDQLFTKAQCKRIQALIALQNIADYYNGEVDYRGVGCVIIFQPDGIEILRTDINYSTPIFRYTQHAQLAIEILRAENLLDNLK